MKKEEGYATLDLWQGFCWKYETQMNQLSKPELSLIKLAPSCWIAFLECNLQWQLGGYHKLCTFNVLIIPTPFRAGQQPGGNSKFPLCNLPHKAWSFPENSHYINKFNLLSAFYTLLRQKLFCSLLLIRFTQSISFHCFHVGFGKKVETSFPWEEAGSRHISIRCKLTTKFSQAACFW